MKSTFSRQNYLILLIGLGLIALGYVLMIGGGSDDPNVFNPAIFDFQRISLAPMVCLAGFVTIVFANMWRPKTGDESVKYGRLSAAAHTVSKGPGRFSRLMKWTVVTLLIAFALYYFICGITYSEGTRSGVLTKISKRGYVFKTYEGDMNIGGLSQGDGTIMPMVVFYFSVQDEDVYNQLQALQGKKSVVYYREVIHSFFWQGETDYYVYKAHDVDAK